MKQQILEALRAQSIACTSLGSPMTGKICELIAQNLNWDTPLGKHLDGWQGDPASNRDNVPLRLAGALHALVLLERDKDLANVYPPHYRESSDATVWAAIEQAFTTHFDFFVERLKFAPQTNEIRRSAVLLPGFMAIAARFDQLLVLSELGSSSGLNLLWDRYRYTMADVQWGDESSPIHLDPDWTGLSPNSTGIAVSERAGCDLNPPDIRDEHQRLLALSYIWADQTERLERTALAMDLAADTNMEITRQDAVSWLQTRLETTHTGKTHVVFHSITRQYFTESDTRESLRLLEQAGSRATHDAPLAWLQMEADGKVPGAGLYLTTWPGNETVELARADYHGRWIEWFGI